MNMYEISIHHRSGSFSDRWISTCIERQISYRLVDAFSTNIVNHLKQSRAFLWHWPHDDYYSALFARQLIYALESFGIHIFPNSRTCFHFDDKLAQKYLLEAVNAPLADTWIFYSIESANAWISTTAFPKVFKLRTGAGSSNVRLVHTPDEAYRLVNVAFSYGFNPVKGYFYDFSTRIRKTHSLNAFFTKLLRAPSVVKDLINKRNIYPPERGYIYFQEFLPGNLYDTRVTVIGNRAFAFIKI